MTAQASGFPVRDPADGDWLVARAGTAWATVGSVAGTGFEAYARVLHPIPVDRVGADGGVTTDWWPWARVAERVGATMHPLVQWTHLVDDMAQATFDDGWRLGQIDEGSLRPELLADLVGHLRRQTTTPDDVTLGLWVGWGELHPESMGFFRVGGPEPDTGWKEQHREERRRAISPQLRAALAADQTMEFPAREYVLLGTDLDTLADPRWGFDAGIGWDPSHAIDQHPNPQLIWPADHSWVVASEIDWDSTLVAGPRALVDAILDDDRFEAFEVREWDSLAWDADTINPPVPHG